MSKQSIDEKPSSTATIVCFFRACANKEKNEQIRGPDHLAKIYMKGIDSFILKLHKITLPIAKRKAPQVYEYIIARTKFFDTIFEQALLENLPQIVFLGAGYDTRPYRFKDCIKQTQIFELDSSPTQKMKQRFLKESDISVPEQLHYVSINFNTQNLGEVLAEAGFDVNKRTLFIWEGVTEYLTPEAVDSTLSFIHKTSGTTVAFNYIYKSVVDGTCDCYGAKEILKATAESDEPYQFGIEEGKIEQFLRERGFDTVSHYTAKELEKKYLTTDDGKLFGRISGYVCLVLAVAK
ncbi:MAG: class I SAM-dependent methyltransferase [archaeon]